MQQNVTDNTTIVALATPPGRGGVGIVRVSGGNAKSIAKALLYHVPKTRYADFCSFHDENGELIDQGIALFFEGPNSFTGEDVLELQGHGGPVVMDSLLLACLQAGAQMAEPGEFSKRAFLNDKIDLTQAEAISDLINASSDAAAKSAMRSLSGAFSDEINAFLRELIELRIFVEAAIDFIDEDIDFVGEQNIIERARGLKKRLEQVVEKTRQGVLLQEGLRVVLAGKPNVGKSSLLNCLTGEHTAIVTDIAGTTRDILKEHITIDGMPLHITDTAGLRETEDVVEQHGISRAMGAIEKADLLLWVVDISKDVKQADIESEIKVLQERVGNIPTLVIANKADLLDGETQGLAFKWPSVLASTKQKSGLEALKAYVKNFAGFNDKEQGQFIARRRHLFAIEKTAKLIDSAISVYEQQKAHELLAEELMQAQHELAQITGEYKADDLLGAIFSTFCIGK